MSCSISVNCYFLLLQGLKKRKESILEILISRCGFTWLKDDFTFFFHQPTQNEGTVTTATVRKGLAEFGTVNQLERYLFFCAFVAYKVFLKHCSLLPWILFRQADCPPKSPQSPSFLTEVICSHESIYIAGQYLVNFQH